VFSLERMAVVEERLIEIDHKRLEIKGTSFGFQK
jgi:hypothetical protein